MITRCVNTDRCIDMYTIAKSWKSIYVSHNSLRMKEMTIISWEALDIQEWCSYRMNISPFIYDIHIRGEGTYKYKYTHIYVLSVSKWLSGLLLNSNNSLNCFTFMICYSSAQTDFKSFNIYIMPHSITWNNVAWKRSILSIILNRSIPVECKLSKRFGSSTMIT